MQNLKPKSNEQYPEVLAALSKLNIPYEITTHQAVYTIEETRALGLMDIGMVCKNLFLKDAKGKNFYLIVMSQDKKADLKDIAAQLGSAKLSFASEERLQTMLGLKKGAVSPLGIMNDQPHTITVAFDASLRIYGKLGVHPNDNTATIWLSFANLEKFVKYYGNNICYIEI